MEFADRLAEMLRKGADTVTNLPTKAQQFLVNPTAFIDTITGKTAMPKEKGFAESATGLPQRENLTVLDPINRAYMEGYSEGEPYGYAALASPLVASGATKLSNKAVQAITRNPNATAMGVMDYAGAYNPANIFAYHGTPHTIQGKFDINKVGTGEGAQAYGHGMYFAENPAVAAEYQKRLSADSALSYQSRNVDSAYISAANNFKDFGTNYEDTLKGLKQAYKQAPEKELEIAAKVAFQPTGNLYKVDIPDEYIPKMLDYDKPIKDQPEILNKVRALIKDPDMLKTFDHNVESGITGANVYANYIPTGVSRFDLLKQRDDLLNKYMTKDMGMSDAVRAMNPDDRFAFSEIAQKIDDLKNKPKIVSQVLNDIGIKGIKYLDQGSRGKGGTSNYVVFDPSDVKLLERNNQPISRKELIQQQIDKIE